MDGPRGRLEGNTAGAMLAVIAALSFAQVFARAVGRSFSYTEEITRLLLVWISLLGAAAAAATGTHLGMRAISAFRPRLRKTLAVAGMIAMSVFFLSLGILGARLVLKVQSTQHTEALGWPKWPFGLAVPVGCAFGLFRTLHRLVIGARTGFEESPAELGEPQDSGVC